MKIIRPKNATYAVSSTRLIRAIASSTAIETGKPVQTIEAKLLREAVKFPQLTLASS